MTVRVFGEANLRNWSWAQVRPPHCIVFYLFKDRFGTCNLSVIHKSSFSFKISPAEGIMPFYHECGRLKQNWTHYPTFSHVAKVKAIDKKSEHPKMQRQDFKAGLSNSASFWRG